LEALAFEGVGGSSSGWSGKDGHLEDTAGHPQRFQRLHAPESLQEVYHGATFVNGVRVMEHEWRVAA
jgi:hypothetical protein